MTTAPKTRRLVLFSGEELEFEGQPPLNKELPRDDGYKKYNAHRTIQEGSNPFDVQGHATFKILKDGRIRALGRASDVNPVTGWSMWSPHAAPSNLLTENGALCLVLDDIPEELTLVHERNYRLKNKTTGDICDFAHLLLSVKEETTKSKCQEYAQQIKTKSCLLGAQGKASHSNFNDGSGSDEEILAKLLDLDDFDEACGDSYACQDVLRRVVQSPDSSFDISCKVSASILYGWIGTGDLSLELIMERSVWASYFILSCFEIMTIPHDYYQDLRVAYDTAISTFTNALYGDEKQDQDTSNVSN